MSTTGRDCGCASWINIGTSKVLFLQIFGFAIFLVIFCADEHSVVLAQKQCHRRICDQQITGRGLNYDRTMQIIQNEEYLTEADKSVIRKRRESANAERFKRQLFGGSNPLSIIANPVIETISKTSNTLTGSGLLPDVLSSGIQSLADTAQAIIDLALAMVPVGMPAISIFPPFTKKRTYPTVVVLFQDLDTSQPSAPLPGADLRDKAFNAFPATEILGQAPNLVSAVGADAIVGKLFGFSAVIRLVDMPCTLGVDCDENGNEIGTNAQDPVGLSSGKSGEDFESNGPPECRTEIDPDGCM